MQALLLVFISVFGYSIAEFAKRALVAVGFAAVTYFGAFAIVDQLTSLFQLQLTGLPLDVLLMLGLMKIDIAFTIIISAYTTRLTFQGWNKLLDNRRGRVWRKPGSSDPTTLGA